MKVRLRFRPVSRSWVAFHPQPKGVIQFIGGAFFGTFAPMYFYRELLQNLFEQEYTIILLPFNFTFDHFKEAGSLIREQYTILPELVRISVIEGYDYKAYLNDKNFTWVGHSLGCKYISLLEGFSSLSEDAQIRNKFIYELLCVNSNQSQILTAITDIDSLITELKLKLDEASKLIYYYIGESINITDIFIKGQKSILLAPDISDTYSAVRPKFLAHFIDSIGLGVKPNSNETFALIQKSRLFNLMGLVQFKSDDIARTTCGWFVNILRKPPKRFYRLLKGGHLRPLGLQIANVVITLENPLILTIEQRRIEFDVQVNQLLKDLKRAEHEID